jgi:6-phosphogluconate dehydrogenase
MIGLGRMGANMVQRLRRGNIDVVGDNRDSSVAEALAGACGMMTADKPSDLVATLNAPRVVRLLLPAGEVTERHVAELAHLLTADDINIDGTNSGFKDSMHRASWLAEMGIQFVDAGVSGDI